MYRLKTPTSITLKLAALAHLLPNKEQYNTTECDSLLHQSHLMRGSKSLGICI